MEEKTGGKHGRSGDRDEKNGSIFEQTLRDRLGLGLATAKGRKPKVAIRLKKKMRAGVDLLESSSKRGAALPSLR